MTFTTMQTEALSAKLDGSVVKQRQQGGRNVSYIEAWQAIATANDIFGFDGWHRSTADMRSVHEPYQNEKGNWVVSYVAKVVVHAGEVTREGTGFGQGIDRDLGKAHESAVKEGESDAMKRALMTFGWPFGLALYDKSGENVERSNGATRPPAKQQPVTITADDLIERVNAAISYHALKATKGHEGFRHDYLALDKVGRAKVEAAIAEKEAMFSMEAG